MRRTNGEAEWKGWPWGRGTFAVAVKNASCRLLLLLNLCGGVRECVWRKKGGGWNNTSVISCSWRAEGNREEEDGKNRGGAADVVSGGGAVAAREWERGIRKLTRAEKKKTGESAELEGQRADRAEPG